MNKDKQIEEMAKNLCGMEKGCDECMFNKVYCYERYDAEELYNAGYRKADEVAREIFAEIEDRLGIGHDILDAWDILAELKKKYTEEKKDV